MPRSTGRYATTYLGTGPRSRPQRRINADDHGTPKAYARHLYWQEVPCRKCLDVMRPIWAAKARTRYARQRADTQPRIGIPQHVCRHCGEYLPHWCANTSARSRRRKELAA